MSSLRRLAAGVPLIVIVALTLAFFYRLAFTDLILARGDTFAYFYPYWDARDTALRAGQLPLWSPDIFMGVPLLANSQVGTFYLPNWLTISFPPPEAIRISILLHIGWAFAGAYLLARRAVTLPRLPALLVAVLFALGGHVGAHVEQINQLQGLSWMPWLFLLLHQALERPLRYTPLLAMGLALQFLSGHTQTVFITGLGLGVYGLAWRRWRFLPVMLAAGAMAGLLASPQLVPTLEMTQVSNRRGGFNPNQATAFSFSPFVVGRGLLPSYDRLIYGEYIAYTGVIGLGLALVGALTKRELATPAVSAAPLQVPDGFTRVTEKIELTGKPPRRWRLRQPSPRFVWAVIALVGLALAFGVYNPVYWWLATLPGFNLFRVPARWLALFALGAAMLAGIGLQALMERRIRWIWILLVVAVVVGLAALSPLAVRTPELVPISEPERVTFVGWAMALIVLVGGLVGGKVLPSLLRSQHVAQGEGNQKKLEEVGKATRQGDRRQSQQRNFAAVVGGLLVIGAVVELFAASQALPYNDLTAPEAYYAHRFTIDQLRALNEGQTPPGRFLSISQLYFDPGDRATLEARYAMMGLSEEAVRAAFVAIKMKETLAANLPLIWHVPTIDGFDGGLLPTAYYTAFTSLMLPEGELRTIDGRLREILAREFCRGACIPDRRWLNLTNTQYLITDKIYDLWHEDIAYDTQFEVLLAGGQSLSSQVLPTFEANAAYVLYHCVELECQPPQVSWRDESSEVVTLAGETESIGVEGNAPYTLATLRTPNIARPQSLEIDSEMPLYITAVTLVDERTGDFVQLTLNGWERILSSDIKLYENPQVIPRAFIVNDWWIVADHEWGTEDALNLMRDPVFDPARTAILSQGLPTALEHGGIDASTESDVTISAYSPERIEIGVNASREGYLILTDAYYPGWTVQIDDEAVPLLRADVMFRAVQIPAGESHIVFEYKPVWLPGALITGVCAWGVVALLAAIVILRKEK